MWMSVLVSDFLLNLWSGQSYILDICRYDVMSKNSRTFCKYKRFFFLRMKTIISVSDCTLQKKIHIYFLSYFVLLDLFNVSHLAFII